MGINTVATCGMQKEASPATSNIQELIARLESELTANQIEFILLRLIKVFMSGPKMRKNTLTSSRATTCKTETADHSDEQWPRCPYSGYELLHYGETVRFAVSLP